MPLTIENKSDQLVLLRFNSGLSYHLAPGKVLEKVEEVEVRRNDRIASLVERRIISVDLDALPSARAAAPAAARAGGARRAKTAGAKPAEAESTAQQRTRKVPAAGTPEQSPPQRPRGGGQGAGSSGGTSTETDGGG